MKVVRCKACKQVIGTSDAKAFYKDGKATQLLTCSGCGHVRKFRK